MTIDEYLVTGEIWRYPGDAGWHFLTLPDAIADELRARYAGEHRPFGSLRVRATLGATTWDTSLFADRRTESYLLPIKAQIRKREELSAGRRVTVTIAPQR
jgi:Domain of unknown function (DUF1905)